MCALSTAVQAVNEAAPSDWLASFNRRRAIGRSFIRVGGASGVRQSGCQITACQFASRSWNRNVSLITRTDEELLVFIKRYRDHSLTPVLSWWVAFTDHRIKNNYVRWVQKRHSTPHLSFLMVSQTSSPAFTHTHTHITGWVMCCLPLGPLLCEDGWSFLRGLLLLNYWSGWVLMIRRLQRK